MGGLESRVMMLTRATARCERGFAFDTSSGRCAAAPCDIAGSNGNPGPACACTSGGNITWSGDAWVGACIIVIQHPIAGLTIGDLSPPPLTVEWQLALNVDTDDGNRVDYYNNNFWQSAEHLGGATDDISRRFTHDFKDKGVFTRNGVTQILVVVHNEGALLGWRRWRTKSRNSLYGYFNKGNSCPGSLSHSASVHVASVTIDAEEGSLSPREPLVMNKLGNRGPTTNNNLYFNVCGNSATDCDRLSTGATTSSDVGWGLGTAYHASGSCDANEADGYIRYMHMQADACLHVTYTSRAWTQGVIGSDCESWENYCSERSGLSYDYAIFVAF